MKYRKYPEFIETAARRHEVYNETLEYIKKREAEGRLLVLRPDGKLPVSKVEKDPQKLKAVYEMGRKVAEERIEEIRRFVI